MSNVFENIEPFKKHAGDTDLSWDSSHHTVGRGPTQAAPGNHKHKMEEITDYIPPDPPAPVDITGKVNKVGDEMTGSLVMKNTGVGVKFNTADVMLYQDSAGLHVVNQAVTVYKPITVLNGAVDTEQAATRNFVDHGYTAGISGSGGFADYGGVYAGAWVSRSGPVVIVEGLMKSNNATVVAIGTAYSVGQIASPSWYPPHTTMCASFMSLSGGTNQSPCRLVINTNGLIQFVPTVAGTFTAGVGWVALTGAYRAF